MPLSKKQIKRIAGLELNALNFIRIMPDALEGGRIRSAGTPIFDVNGKVLFHRLPIKRGRRHIGYADIGVNKALGEPLLASSIGIKWNKKGILEEATAAAKKRRRSLKFNKVRFVAYSYPKIAVQFLKGDKEVLMLEWKTWAEVPPAAAIGRPSMKPSNFERWSLLDEMPTTIKRSNARKFKKRLQVWESRKMRSIESTVIKRKAFELPGFTLRFVDTREIHYAPRMADTHPCYELRGQQTGVWCVAASTEMLLNFYRYQYEQIRLADELDLGTCAHPAGLPYSQVAKVVTVIEDLTSNALNATMHTNPGWKIFRDEIRANRPLISFIPGHSRTVTGYTESMIHLPNKLPFRGLLVNDPWPPTDCDHPEAGGVITKWENFATQTYQYAYSAVLKHA